MEDFSEASNLRMREIKPALTAEEWAKADIAVVDQRRMAIKNTLDVNDPSDFHAVAAIALHGQLFGLRNDERRPFSGYRRTATEYFQVEARGFEPRSETRSTTASTCVFH
jgi:hypothetical protein